MGFEVEVVVQLLKPPGEAVMTALDHQFESASHVAGTKIVTLTEHVSMSDEADAVEFVRALVLDAIPAGGKITDLTAAAD